jgi:anti-sigma B factor antagonist
MTDSHLVIPAPRSEDDEPPVLQGVATNVTDGLAVVEIRGDLDALTASGFDRWVREQLEGHVDVVLDLDGVAFLASAGIGALITIRQEAARLGVRLHVTGRGNRAVQRPLQVLGLERFVELRDDTRALVVELATTS